MGGAQVRGREGNGGANHDFEGTVDDVRSYTRALGQADIAALAGGALWLRTGRDLGIQLYVPNSSGGI